MVTTDEISSGLGIDSSIAKNSAWHYEDAPGRSMWHKLQQVKSIRLFNLSMIEVYATYNIYIEYCETKFNVWVESHPEIQFIFCLLIVDVNKTGGYPDPGSIALLWLCKNVESERENKKPEPALEAGTWVLVEYDTESFPGTIKHVCKTSWRYGRSMFMINLQSCSVYLVWPISSSGCGWSVRGGYYELCWREQVLHSIYEIW